MTVERIDIAPLQAAFLESGLSASEVAFRLGWLNGPKPDTSRVMRALGLATYTAKGGRRWTSKDASLQNAAKLCRALHIDPIDVGL